MAPHSQSHTLPRMSPIRECIEPSTCDTEQIKRLKPVAGTWQKGLESGDKHPLNASHSFGINSCDGEDFKYASPAAGVIHSTMRKTNISPDPAQVRSTHQTIRHSMRDFKSYCSLKSMASAAAKPGASNLVNTMDTGASVLTGNPETVRPVEITPKNAIGKEGDQYTPIESLSRGIYGVTPITADESPDFPIAQDIQHPSQVEFPEAELPEISEAAQVSESPETQQFPHASDPAEIPARLELLEFPKSPVIQDDSHASDAQRVFPQKPRRRKGPVISGRVAKPLRKKTPAPNEPGPDRIDAARALQILQWAIDGDRQLLEKAQTARVEKLNKETSDIVQSLKSEKDIAILAAEQQLIQARQDQAVLTERLANADEKTKELRHQRHADKQRLRDFSKRLADHRNFVNGLICDFEKERSSHSELKQDCEILRQEIGEMQSTIRVNNEKASHLVGSAESLVRRQQELTKDAVTAGDVLANEKLVLQRLLEDKCKELDQERAARARAEQVNAEKSSLETTIRALLSGEDAPLIKQIQELSKSVQKDTDCAAANPEKDELVALVKAIHSRPEATPIDLQSVEGLVKGATIKIEMLASQVAATSALHLAADESQNPSPEWTKIESHLESLRSDFSAAASLKLEFKELQNTNSSLKHQIAAQAEELSEKQLQIEQTVQENHQVHANIKNLEDFKETLSSSLDKALQENMALEKVQAEALWFANQSMSVALAEAHVLKGNLRTAEEKIEALEQEKETLNQKATGKIEAGRVQMQLDMEKTMARRKAELENQLYQAQKKQTEADIKVRNLCTEHARAVEELEKAYEKAMEDASKLHSDEIQQQKLDAEAKVTEALKKLEDISHVEKEHEGNMNTLRNDKAQLESEIERLNKKISEDAAEVEDFIKEFTNLQQHLKQTEAELCDKITALTKENKTLVDKLSELPKRRHPLRTVVADSQEFADSSELSSCPSLSIPSDINSSPLEKKAVALSRSPLRSCGVALSHPREPSVVPESQYSSPPETHSAATSNRKPTASSQNGPRRQGTQMQLANMFDFALALGSDTQQLPFPPEFARPDLELYRASRLATSASPKPPKPPPQVPAKPQRKRILFDAKEEGLMKKMATSRRNVRTPTSKPENFGVVGSPHASGRPQYGVQKTMTQTVRKTVHTSRFSKELGKPKI